MSNTFYFKTPNHHWCFSYIIEETDVWLKTYASIMGFTFSPVEIFDSSQLFIFVAKWPNSENITLSHLNETTQSLDLALPVTGWKLENYKIFSFCHHHSCPYKIVFIRDFSAMDRDLDFIQMAALLHLVFRETIDSGGTCYHGGLIEYQGQGILLSGPSGTGKSTCCRRIPSPWKALSDDECLISWHDQQFKIQPLPTWSVFFSFNQNKVNDTTRKNWDTSRVLPLRAIFLLQKGEEDKATPVGQGDAVMSLLREALGPFYRAVSVQQRQDEDVIHYKTQIFNNICHLAKTVPVYDLSVRKDGEFWREIERVLG